MHNELKSTTLDIKLKIMIKIKNISHLHVKHFTRNPAVAEKADRTALSQIAVQHADDGYCRRGNFGSFLVHSTF